MSTVLKYISKVEIKGLWGRYDISWNLNEDVSILSGINGSGKSTILNCLAGLITNAFEMNRKRFDEISKLLSDCKITFNNNGYFSFKFIKVNPKNPKEAENQFIEEYEESPISLTVGDYRLFIRVSKGFIILNELFQIDKISTFDTELKPLEAVQKLSDSSVRTELDWEISQLQNTYLSYQIDIGKRAFDAISNGETNGKVIKIKATQERFLSIIDHLFQSTGKRINRTENKISFLSGEEKISAYQLSSGEKQLLIILLTVLVQDNKQAILFMDEPEISLHFDWQKKLIDYIRELNPNVQIILATHSPAIVMDGWLDKISNVSDLVKSA
jgi:energy-coupling factor transporter ATP-binding protein EcfA2